MRRGFDIRPSHSCHVPCDSTAATRIAFWAYEQTEAIGGLCWLRADERGLHSMGSPANWRCVALEKLSRVKLVQGAWRTAPNHLRPASCVAEADIDGEDHPERDPQKGH
jgi:hypothetical protein